MKTVWLTVAFIGLMTAAMIQAIAFVDVKSEQDYTATLSHAQSVAYFKINLTSSGIDHFHPRVQSCTGRVNIFGLVCVPDVNSTCIDEDFVPSAVYNEFQFLDNNAKNRGQKEITDFDMCDGPKGRCKSNDGIYYLAITSSTPYNPVTFKFTVHTDEIVDYAQTPIRYDNSTGELSWDKLSICKQRSEISGECTEKVVVDKRINYIIYYQQQLNHASDSSLEANLATTCGLRNPGVHQSWNEERTSFNPAKVWTRTGFYQVTVVAELRAQEDTPPVVYESIIVEYEFKGKIPVTRSTAGLVAGLIIGFILCCCVTSVVLTFGIYSIYYDRRYGYKEVNTENPNPSTDTTTTDTATIHHQ